MAPNRSKKAVGTVVKTTTKVVEETVKIDLDIRDSKDEEKETEEEKAEHKKKKKKKKRKRRGGYKRYVLRVLKQVHPGMRASAAAMLVIEGMMSDMFERIAEEAKQLSKYTGKVTMSSREIQDAVRLVIPGELGKHAISEGVKAVTTYMEK